MGPIEAIGGVFSVSPAPAALADRYAEQREFDHESSRGVGAVRLSHGIVLGVVLAWALAAPRAAAQVPWITAPVELRGPLESVVLTAPGARTELRVPLANGETRTVRAPFGGGSLANLEPSAAAKALRVQTRPAGGSARVVAEDAEGPGRLARSIAARGRPSAGPERPRPDPVRWFVVAAGVVLVIGLRRRPARAAGAGVVAGAALWLVPAAPLVGGASSGLDGDLGSGRWVLARAADGRVAVEPGALGWMDARGAGTPSWTVMEGEWTLALAGGEVHVLLPLAAPEFAPAGPPAMGLERLWLRAPDGRWSAHGAWRPGEPFPPTERPEAGMPPGRLAAGLPQGVGVLVGIPSGSRAPDWLRMTGWTPAERVERR